MARPLRIAFPGAFYHITARGNEGREIFKSLRDREQFLSYLESAVRRYDAVIHVYCLMGNHYHLLLETPSANVSQILRHINGAYTTYFNTKRDRSGHLFQGRFKAILVNADQYAVELSRYIHLNPVRAGVARHPEEYLWSSCAYYTGGKRKPDWLSLDFILNYFDSTVSSSQSQYREFVNASVTKEYESPLKAAIASAILGSSDFVNAIKEKHLTSRKPDRDLPALRELTKASIPEILKKAEALFGEDSSLSRKATLYLCHRFSGRTLKEVGSYFGIGESAVSQASRRFAESLEHNNELRRKTLVVRKKAGLCKV
jgi:REP element-mobilizing transposase RayT